MVVQVSPGALALVYPDSNGSQVTKNPKEMAGTLKNNSCGWEENLFLMAELRRRILTFRDIIGLPPCDGYGPVHELAMDTVEDLGSLSPAVVFCNSTSKTEQTSLNQALSLIYNALKCLGDSWAKNHRCITNSADDINDRMEDDLSLEQLSQRVLVKLNQMIDIARKMFDVMEEDEEENDGSIQGSTIGKMLSYFYKKSTFLSPDTPASLSPELAFSITLGRFADDSRSSFFLMPLRLQDVEKLRPMERKYLPLKRSLPASSQDDSSMKAMNLLGSIAKMNYEGPKDSKYSDKLPGVPSLESNVMSEAKESAAVSDPPPPSLFNPAPTMQVYNQDSNRSAVPPPPPPPPPKGSVPMPSTPLSLGKGAAPPPPPPPGATKALRPKRNTKLKRSNHMGIMYRLLRGKVEGSTLNVEHSKGRKPQFGGAASGNQGMADALAEMTKRSAYFQHIEEDVRNHAQLIMEIKAAIDSFKTKDMAQLLKFHKYVEQHLEKLTDETQVLAKFEQFPTKKLESLRSAAALYLKLEEIATTLKNWKVMPPIGGHIEKIESYFNKIKREIDALERSKDEESKKFQCHNIHFDFNVLVKIKESMVDVSSSCMELALKEQREEKAAESEENGPKIKGQPKTGAKMLWRAFQLAFRVYTFAGGQDDRADILTKELAHEIETDPSPKGD